MSDPLLQLGAAAICKAVEDLRGRDWVLGLDSLVWLLESGGAWLNVYGIDRDLLFWIASSGGGPHVRNKNRKRRRSASKPAGRDELEGANAIPGGFV